MKAARLILVCTAIASGCATPMPPLATPAGWQTFNADNRFTFKAPPDVTRIPVQGIDSFVGSYESPTRKITFDHGWYSDPLDKTGIARKRVLIDGRTAYWVVDGNTRAVHVPDVDTPQWMPRSNATRLTFRVELNGADPQSADTILRSIDFP